MKIPKRKLVPYDYVTVKQRIERGEVVQTLTNGFEVKTLQSNLNKTVTLNGVLTLQIKDFHDRGGIIALYHDHAHDRKRQSAFTPY